MPRNHSDVLKKPQEGHRPQPWSSGAALAGLVFLLIPAGSLADLGLGSSPIPAPYLVAPVLLLHTLGAHSATSSRRRVRLHSLGPTSLWALIPLAAAILIVHSVTQEASFTALHFAMGVLLGILVGVTWAHAGNKFNFVSLGFALFVAISIAQLLRIFTSTPSISAFHNAAVLSWGASNYVAGVLVVSGFILIGKKPVGKLSTVIALSAFAIAVATLSRGALVALAVGTATHLWSAGRTPGSRFLLRTSCIVVPLVGLNILDRVTQLRSTGGYDPSQNTEARFVLYRTAWEQFLGSPLIGTGWTGLEAALPSQFVTSFAHNAILSFLQMGGLIGLIILIILYRNNKVAWSERTARSALASAFAISMTDPFYEGFVGCLLVLTAIVATSMSRDLDAESYTTLADPSAKNRQSEPGGQPLRSKSLSRQSETSPTPPIA